MANGTGIERDIKQILIKRMTILKKIDAKHQ